MQNEHNFIFSGRDSFEIRGGGRHSSTYGGQIVDIKINIDLFMSFFTNGLQKIVCYCKPCTPASTLRLSSCSSQHKSQDENHLRFQTSLFPMVPLDIIIQLSKVGNDIETGRCRVEKSPHFYWFRLLSCPRWLSQNQNKCFL